MANARSQMSAREKKLEDDRQQERVLRKVEERQKEVQDDITKRRGKRRPIADIHQRDKDEKYGKQVPGYGVSDKDSSTSRFRSDLDVHKGNPLERLNNGTNPDNEDVADSSEGIGAKERASGDVGTGYGNGETREVGDAGFYAEGSDQEEIEELAREEEKQKRKLQIKKKKGQKRKFWFFVAGNLGLGGFILAMLLTLGIAIIVLGGVVAIIASEEGGAKTEQVADGGGEPTGGGSGEQPKVENPGSASSEGFSNPLSGTPKVTSPYGPRNLMGADFHKGTDFACKKGETPILAAKKGKIGWAKFGAPGSGFGGYGNVVVIEHEGGLWTLYGHMTSLNVQEGQQVEAGTQLGICGATGQVTGPHLHFEVKTAFKFGQVDPTKYLPK